MIIKSIYIQKLCDKDEWQDTNQYSFYYLMGHRLYQWTHKLLLQASPVLEQIQAYALQLQGSERPWHQH